MITNKFKIRTWLWVILSSVAILGGSFTYFYHNSGQSTILNMSSPISIKSSLVLPSPSSRTTDTTPTTLGAVTQDNGQATPATPTVTPTLTPPNGWRIETNTATLGRGTATSGSYQVYIKNNWISVSGGDILYPKAIVAYTNDNACKASNYGMSDDVLNSFCLFSVSVGRADSMPQATSNIYYYPAKVLIGNSGSVGYLTLTFTPQISKEDKQTVLSSFQSLQ